jgi:hypothetical protein
MAGKVTRRAVGTVVAVVGACLAYAAVKAAHGPTRRNGFVRSFQHFPSERDRGFESVYLFHGNRRSVSSRACVRGGGTAEKAATLSVSTTAAPARCRQLPASELDS